MMEVTTTEPKKTPKTHTVIVHCLDPSNPFIPDSKIWKGYGSIPIIEKHDINTLYTDTSEHTIECNLPLDDDSMTIIYNNLNTINKVKIGNILHFVEEDRYYFVTFPPYLLDI